MAYLACTIWGILIGTCFGYALARDEIKLWKDAATHWREAAELWERIR